MYLRLVVLRIRTPKDTSHRRRAFTRAEIQPRTTVRDLRSENSRTVAGALTPPAGFGKGAEGSLEALFSRPCGRTLPVGLSFSSRALLQTCVHA
ncbi:hypothetical protein CC86DRAFT_159351 [Ophiobolus disseminans]|uniref:Uncharacterized protein n=1 Tax=Ophiobolus disseminans TaxID=1469910 RepID=A0A6A6ZDQ5_9PLEO|nr:hypothetical protein CC86DRAFT_159351 [Ophiobolus disseminans]